MRYLLALLCPPLAILLCGRPLLALLNIPLCIMFWVPGVIHALLVVHEHKEERRTRRIIREFQAAR